MTDFDIFFQDLSSLIRQYVQTIFSDQDILTFIRTYAFFLAFVVILLFYNNTCEKAATFKCADGSAAMKCFC